MLKQTGFLLLTLVLLAGCVPAAAETVDQVILAFAANVMVQDDGAAKMTVGLRNDGRSPFSGSDTFNGVLIVRDADSSDLRARAELQTVGALDPGESTFPLGWEGKLAPGTYKLVWGAADYGMTNAGFTVVDGSWTMLYLNSEADAEVLQLGPQVKTYVNRAREEAAILEEIPVGEIALLRVEAISAATGTYRIELGAKDRTFTYHADGDGVALVPLGTPREPLASHDAREVEDYVDLVDALRRQGATVKPRGAISQPFFSVEGQLIAVNGADVQIYEYVDDAAAQAVSATVSPDGSQIGDSVVDWVARSYFYHQGRLIVLYVGEDADTITLLESVLGSLFAGGQTSPTEIAS